MPMPERQRVDKWLWAARFFKTRSLATKAIDGGHVSVNGEKVKPSRHLYVGDHITVFTPSGEFLLKVKGLNAMRRTASDARLLYEESPASSLARAKLAEEFKLAPVFDHSVVRGRPTKKWRRQIHRFERNNV